jgi:hypothetical protein
MPSGAGQSVLQAAQRSALSSAPAQAGQASRAKAAAKELQKIE